MNPTIYRSLPTKPGVYIFKNARNNVIYVGKAKDLRKRVANYFSNKALESKVLRMISEANALDHIVVASEIEAFLLESNLIKKYKPSYNVIFVDDKSYPYLEVNRKPIPYVVITHKKGNKNAVYLGPYVGSGDLKIVLRLLRRVFPYQSVKNHAPKRCLYYHLGLCPCIPAFPDKLPEYKKNIRNLIAFLKGDINSVVRNLKKEQHALVRKEEFEKAADVQRKIEKIDYITSENYEPFHYEEKPDFYFERIRAEVASLSEILNKYGLGARDLKRIECYDISNISGKYATGSMVVFIDGDSNKNEYRRFKIRFKKTPDDFAMLEEVMRRRIKCDDWGKPNLMVIDGGKGQVSSVLKVFAEANYSVPVIGLAKKEETIVIPIRTGLAAGPVADSEESLTRREGPLARRGLDFLEVKLPHSTPGVNLLRRIRDEAHRFALHYHRLLRKKSLNL